ncbi:MAG: polyribonucleotide nucleotidyltransferase [Candidatus Alcyoniella australis]|nr:polyribonucleotide nucleotidyltransferase [Candidatus Alcyoniella australis]
MQMDIKEIKQEFSGRTLILQTGKMAKQADGAVLIQHGETQVLVTATSSHKAREGQNFLPLVCDYQENNYAAGKIPGGFFKREGRPTEKEVLTSRLIDRPMRPLFPKGYKFDIQIIANVLSADKQNESDVLAITAASAALTISDIPFDGPIAGVRVGRVEGEMVCNPTLEQSEQSDIDIIVAGRREGLVMVEGRASMLSEDEMADALLFAHKEMQPLLDMQQELCEQAGRSKRAFEVHQIDQQILDKVAQLAPEKIKAAVAINEKLPRYHAMDAARAEVLEQALAELGEETPAADVLEAFSSLHKQIVREQMLSTSRRIGGRGPEDIREITCEVGLLCRTHGSALFTRGETQALVTTTLGSGGDVQRVEGLSGESKKNFMLHYNFPPFSVGEVRMLRGPSRREIGHGALAERAIKMVLPDVDSFPYTIRIVSEVLESNGSSSMATVCGGVLSLMDAGVPISHPVAGIAMGLVTDGERTMILSDILGDEDHLGDMDFKVTGSMDGITALQMDIKIPVVSEELLRKALYQARDGRKHILGKMLDALPQPRSELSEHAPRFTILYISPDRIRDVIGPGGKYIRGIIEQTGVKIEVEDDGKVTIFSADVNSAHEAEKLVREHAAEVEVGTIYLGLVKRVTDFGAFVEVIPPSTDGLVHISELADHRIQSVTDVTHEGEELLVKVIDVDKNGRIRLSHREVMNEDPEKYRRK